MMSALSEPSSIGAGITKNHTNQQEGLHAINSGQRWSEATASVTLLLTFRFSFEGVINYQMKVKDQARHMWRHPMVRTEMDRI